MPLRVTVSQRHLRLMDAMPCDAMQTTDRMGKTFVPSATRPPVPSMRRKVNNTSKDLSKAFYYYYLFSS